MALFEEVDARLGDKIDKRIGEGTYGLAHELIGKPCIWVDQMGVEYPAIPFGSHILDESAGEYVGKDRIGMPLLTIAFYDPKSAYQGRGLEVKALSGIEEKSLTPIDPNSRLAMQTSHHILNWLASNRDGTLEVEQRRRQQEPLKA